MNSANLVFFMEGFNLYERLIPYLHMLNFCIIYTIPLELGLDQDQDENMFS